MAAAFFANDGIVGSRGTQPGDDHRFCFAVELGDHVGVGEFRAHHVDALGATHPRAIAGATSQVARECEQVAR